MSFSWEVNFNPVCSPLFAAKCKNALKTGAVWYLAHIWAKKCHCAVIYFVISCLSVHDFCGVEDMNIDEHLPGVVFAKKGLRDL